MEILSNYIVSDDGKLKYSFFYKQANEKRNEILIRLNKIFILKLRYDKKNRNPST